MKARAKKGGNAAYSKACNRSSSKCLRPSIRPVPAWPTLSAFQATEAGAATQNQGEANRRDTMTIATDTEPLDVRIAQTERRLLEAVSEAVEQLGWRCSFVELYLDGSDAHGQHHSRLSKKYGYPDSCLSAWRAQR